MKVVMPKSWKLPSEIIKREARAYFHVRLPHDLVTWIQAEAMGVGITGTQLIEETMTDYRRWVETKRAAKRAAQ